VRTQAAGMTQVVFSVDGQPGADGADGISWTAPASTASDGRRGGDGRPGQPGGHAGDLDARLWWSAGTVAVEAVGSGRQFAHAFAATAEDRIVLSARGGDGGRGGDAGRGQDGGRGHRGSDATRFSSGSNGGRGGDGGNAGEPAPGGAAGAGGTIRVRVAEDDMDLLVALAQQIAAGRPGDGGRGAQGGAGGSGGSGGSSHSWTESYQDTERYTDSQGRSQTRTVTRTRHRSNSGGFSGPSGNDGRPSRQVRAASGDPAADGFVAFRVDFADGPRQFAAIYDPVVVATELAPVDARLFPGDCVEPGQRLAVTRVTVRNQGGMPTPTTRDTVLRIIASEDIRPVSGIVLPRGLAPGAEVVLDAPGGLFAVVDRRTTADEPWEAIADLRVAVVVGRLGRDQSDVHVHPIATRSPIALLPLDLFRSLGTGECTRCGWTVENRSLIAFGAEAPGHARHDGPAQVRSLATLVADPGGDADAALLAVLRDGSAVAAPAHGRVADAIPVLPAGARVELAAVLGWRSGAAAFTGRELTFALAVGGHDDGLAQHLQLRSETLKVAPVYVHGPESSVLLVTNHGTTQDEVAAWRRFLDDLALGSDVIDLAREGSVDLDERYSPTQSLREEWRGRTVIALNNPWTGPNGEQSAADYLFDRQVVNALLDDGVSFYAPGEGRPLIAATALLSSRRRGRRIARRTVAAGRLHREHPEDDGELLLTVTAKPWFGKPDPRRLIHDAARLGRRLAVDLPGRRFLVVHRAAARAERNDLGGWTIGTVEIRPLPDGGAASFAALRGEDIHDPAWVGGAANRSAMILALPFDEKLRLFTSLVLASYNHDLHPDRAVLAAAYADALVADLAMEQEAVRDTAWSPAAWALANIFGEGGRTWVPRLSQLCTTGMMAALPAGSARGRILAGLIGRLRAIVDDASPGWDILWPIARRRAITRQSRRLLALLERTAFGRNLPIFRMPDDPWTDERANLSAARRAAATARTTAHRRRGKDRDPLIATLRGACPGLDPAVCVLRRLFENAAQRTVAGADVDRASQAQDDEDARTAERTSHHRAERRRLVGQLREAGGQGASLA
jgi:hypothetical protein